MQTDWLEVLFYCLSFTVCDASTLQVESGDLNLGPCAPSHMHSTSCAPPNPQSDVILKD